MTKQEIIEKIKEEQKERLLKIGYKEENTAFLNDIVDVCFFGRESSRIILKNGTELYL